MMRLRTALTLLILAVAVALAAAPDAFASPRGVRAVTPSAASILKQAAQAVKRLGTAHGTGTSTITRQVKTKSGYKTLSDLGVFVGNASTTGANRSTVQEEFATRFNGTVKSGSMTYITVRSKMADRAGKAKSWTCRKTSYLNTIDVWTPVDFGIVSAHEKGHLTVAGSETFHGVAAWVILQTATLTDGKIKEHLHSNYVVDKKTDLVLEVATVQSATVGGRPASLVNAATFSHYGEQLKVKLPSCH
jgi:hypothetical protein